MKGYSVDLDKRLSLKAHRRERGAAGAPECDTAGDKRRDHGGKRSSDLYRRAGVSITPTSGGQVTNSTLEFNASPATTQDARIGY